MDQDKNIHYTERERMLLVQLISEEKAVENKKTGATDLKDKAEAWERITQKYASQGVTPCTTKQLRKFWDNMKQKKRKLNTTIRHERLMTGGGPPLVQPNDLVMEYMDATNANLDVEVGCIFDSTAVFEKQYNVKTDCTSQKTLIVHDTNVEKEEDIIDLCNQNVLTKKSSVKDIENIRDEKTLQLIKIREAIEQQRELHASKMKIAEAEEKIVLLKLLKEEEAVKQHRLYLEEERVLWLLSTIWLPLLSPSY